MKIGYVIFLSFTFAGCVYATPADDTLSYYLSKSTIVVSGEVQDLICLSSDSNWCIFHLRVDETFQGKIQKGAIIVFESHPFWGLDYHLPCDDKGAKCIVFL